MTLLEITGLRAGYGHVEVLHGVSLTVPEGRIVAIVGPNGAGTPTLVGAVMGLPARRAQPRSDFPEGTVRGVRGPLRGHLTVAKWS